MAEYRVYVSTDFEHNTFSVDTRDKAMELFTMATRSGLYDYVYISKVVERENVLCEWEATK